MNGSSSQLTISGNIGGGALTKTGAGKLILSGTNSFSGLAIGGGNVELSGSGSISGVSFTGSGTLTNNSSAPITGPLTIASGSVLNGNGTMAGLVTVASGGTLSPGNSPGTITFQSGLALASGSTFTVELASDSNYDVASVTGGNVDLGGSTLNPLPEYGLSGTATYWIVNNSGSGTLSARSPGRPVAATLS